MLQHSRSGFYALSLVFSLSRVAGAQNYRELPIGGRTATMGGAATAAGNDSAMPYLNPAGLAGVPGDIFAVSATVYGYTNRSIKDYFYPNGTHPLFGYEQTNQSFSMSSINELPSSVMYFRHLNKPGASVHQHVGISLVIPSSRRVDIVASVGGHLTKVGGEAIETSSMTVDANRYYLGPSYAIGFTDKLRLGISAYAVYVRNVRTSASASSYSLLGGSSTFTYNDQATLISDSVSVVPVIGLQAKIVGNLRAGLGFAPPSLPISGRERYNASTSSVQPDPVSGAPTSTASLFAADLNFQAYEPLRLNAGIAYEDRKRFSFAADVYYFAPRVRTRVNGVQSNEQRQSGELTRRYRNEVSFDTRVESVLDFSVGGEVALSRLFALRAGFFSDISATPPIGTSLDYAGEMRLDRYGTTFGVGLMAGSFDSTLGVVLVHGEGQYGAADTWITGKVVPVRTTESTAMLVLSGAVTEEEAKKKIHDALPFEVPLLPDLGGHAVPPAPRRPQPLPPETKPAPPPLKSRAVAPSAPVDGENGSAPSQPPVAPPSPVPDKEPPSGTAPLVAPPAPQVRPGTP
jgi:hypothetical protein